MSNTDWWSKKLGGQPSSTSSTPATTPPGSVPYRAAPGLPNTQVSYDIATDQVVTRAQSAKQSLTCPACYGVNYMKIGTQATQNGSFDVMRCYDCGYPIVQQGSGLSGSSSGGPATPAKQVNQGSGFNPVPQEKM